MTIKSSTLVLITPACEPHGSQSTDLRVGLCLAFLLTLSPPAAEAGVAQAWAQYYTKVVNSVDESHRIVSDKAGDIVVASVFPDGRVVYGSQLIEGPDLQKRFNPYLYNGVKDLGFVLDELTRLNNNDPLFAGRLDLKRLGSFGFSQGSVLAAEFCRVEARCKAVAIFDSGYLMEAATNLYRLGLQKPFLFMSSTGGWLDPSPGFGPWLDSATNLFAKATSDAIWFRLQDSTHQSYNDKGSLVNDPTMTVDPTVVSRAQSRTIRACTLSFFNRYLKGEDDHLLDNPALIHTNIVNFQRK